MAFQDESIATGVRNAVRRTRSSDKPSSPTEKETSNAGIQEDFCMNCIPVWEESKSAQRTIDSARVNVLTARPAPLISFSRSAGRSKTRRLPATGRTIKTVRIEGIQNRSLEPQDQDTENHDDPKNEHERVALRHAALDPAQPVADLNNQRR